ncbi:hypothetical protein DFQ30_003725 [Apophysomyces sp. BC1015]|nr:hypothetical protein DFQ30_003725 [Apophysomyces sp. BC1015]
MDKHPEFNQRTLNCLLLNVDTTAFICLHTLRNRIQLNNFGPSPVEEILRVRDPGFLGGYIELAVWVAGMIHIKQDLLQIWPQEFPVRLVGRSSGKFGGEVVQHLRYWVRDRMRDPQAIVRAEAGNKVVPTGVAIAAVWAFL